MEQHQEVLQIDPDEADELRHLARERGVELQAVDVHGLDLDGTIIMLLAGPPPAVSSVLRQMDEGRGGQVIDHRPDTARVVYRSRDLRRDLLLVHTPDGSVEIGYPADGRSPAEARESLTKKLLVLRPADARSVADAARLQLGDGASITTQH